MNVSLPPEQEKFIDQLVQQGRYVTPGEVIREALYLLQEQEADRERKRTALKAEIQIGLDQLDRGEFHEYDEESLKALFEQIKAQGLSKQAPRKAECA